MYLKKLCIYLLAVLDCCSGFSLLVAEREVILAAVCRLLLGWLLLLHSMDSRVHALQQLQTLGSTVAVPGAQEYRLNSCGVWAWLISGMWDVLRPGIKTLGVGRWVLHQ